MHSSRYICYFISQWKEKSVNTRKDVKRNYILIFLYVHGIPCLWFLTFKKNSETKAFFLFRLLLIYTCFYYSGKYIDLNSDTCVNSDFRNIPIHFISKRSALLLYSKGDWDMLELRGACCTLLWSANKKVEN